MWLTTTLCSILILNWKITDSVRPLMAAQQFLMVIKCWIDLYFKKLKRTHLYLSPCLSLFIIILLLLHKLHHLPLFMCVIERNVWLTYLPLYLWTYLLFRPLSKLCSVRLRLMLLQRKILNLFMSRCWVQLSLLPSFWTTNASLSEGWTDFQGKGLTLLETN